MTTTMNATPKTIRREFYGEASRYCLKTFRTRFGTTTYFVADAEQSDEEGFPLVVFQGDSREEALKCVEALVAQG